MKKLYSVILVLALLLPVLSGCQSSNPQATPTNPPSPTQTTAAQTDPVDTQTDPVDTQPVTTAPVVTEPAVKLITLEEAINIALKDAGLTKDQVQDLDAELDRDAGVVHYDVDFEKDNKDYDYEIHAETGEILKAEKPKKATQTSVTTTKKQLTRQEAIDIALKHAGVKSDQVRDLDAELDKDDGTVHYDVDFEADGYDYDYEIHAESGKILKSKKERD